MKALNIRKAKLQRVVQFKIVWFTCNNYSFEFTPTETSAGGTLLYIANRLPFKCSNDLNIY